MKTKTLCILTALCGGALVTLAPAQTGAAGAGSAATGAGSTSANATGSSTAGSEAASGGTSATEIRASSAIGGAVPNTNTGANTGLGSSAIDASSSLPNLGNPGLPSSTVRPGAVGTNPIGPQPLTGPRRIRGVGQQPPIGVGRQPDAGVGQQPDMGVGQEPPAGVGLSPDMTGVGALPPMIVPVAPPDTPVGAHVTPPSPAPTVNHVWVPGHYTWDGRSWQLNGGRWVVAPAAGAVWISGAYDPATQTWTPGFWEIDPNSPRARGRPQPTRETNPATSRP